MAAWAERRGFATAIMSGCSTHRSGVRTMSPPSRLCGLDNGVGRQALDQVGFDFVVEAGLGRGHRDFRAIRLHTLPASRPARRRSGAARRPTIEVEDRPAYRACSTSGALDRCGVTLLAGKAVGAPFVGAVAATLAVDRGAASPAWRRRARIHRPRSQGAGIPQRSADAAGLQHPQSRLCFDLGMIVHTCR